MYSANNILYEWLECISMGSFLGTSLSNVITTDPEQKVIRKFVNNDIHKFYEHSCSGLKHPEHVDIVHKALTKFEKKTKFYSCTFQGNVSHFLKLMSTIFHYFWKNNVLLGYFERNTLKRSLTYSCFNSPLFHEHSFSPELTRIARLLKTSCFEKITVCVIEAMLMRMPLVQMNKAQREANQQIKYRLI